MKLRFWTHGADAEHDNILVLNEAGNVTMSGDLDVDGTITADLTGDVDAVGIVASTITALNVSGLRLEDDGNNLGVFIEDGGQVGIGMTNPTEALEVHNGSIKISTTTGNEGMIFQDNSVLTSAGYLRWKPADESVATSETYQDDNDLYADLMLGTTYHIEGRLHMVSASAVPDCKIRFSIPAGSTITLSGFGAEKGGTFFSIDAHSDLEENTIDLGAGVHSDLNFWGMIFVGPTSGRFKLQWAQDTSNADATTIQKGSTLHVRKAE